MIDPDGLRARGGATRRVAALIGLLGLGLLVVGVLGEDPAIAVPGAIFGVFAVPTLLYAQRFDGAAERADAERAQLLACGVRVAATVTEIRRRSVLGYDINEWDVTWRTEGGTAIVARSLAPWSVGDSAELVYDAEHPERVTLSKA